MPFYSFTRESDETSYFYTFLTERKFIINVTFDYALYRDFLDDFPFLIAHGYALGFYSIPALNDVKKGKDLQVRETICKIVEDHFNVCGKESVLLYYYDTSDNRQHCRHLLFDKWYKDSDLKNDYTKETIEVEIEQESGIKIYYLGYITSKNNPNLDKIKEEFNAFSYNMIYPDITKY